MIHLLVLTLIVGVTQMQHELQNQALRFTLSAEKPTYFVYEPIVLDMIVINTGQQPIRGDFETLSFGSKELKLYYRKKGGEFSEYFSVRLWLAQGDDYVPGIREKPTLEPGDQKSTRGMLLYNIALEEGRNPQFVFNEPGEYEFKATYYYILGNPSKILESDVSSVTIVNPPKAERKALALWARKEVAYIVQDDIWMASAWRGDVSPVEAFKRLEMFVQQFPKSVYAVHAREAQARWLGYLEERAKERRLTEEGQKVYQWLRQKN
jgi:hypothetical protein